MIDIKFKTNEAIGTIVRAWDFEPCPDRPNRFVDGIIVGYIEDRDLLVIDVAFDSTGRNRDRIFTPPFGHCMDDDDWNRIEVTA